MKKEIEILAALIRDWNFYSQQPGVCRMLICSRTVENPRLRIVFRALLLHGGNFNSDCCEWIRREFRKIGADFTQFFNWAQKAREKKVRALLPEKCEVQS